MHGLPGDTPQIVEPASQAVPRSTNHVLSEEELAAQQSYIDSFGLSQTTNVAHLATQISQDLNQRQRERLLASGPADRAVVQQPLGLATNNIDALIVRARQVQQQVYDLPASTDSARTAKPKAQSKPRVKKSGPTAMQRAPLSVSDDPDERRVKIEVSEDGTPRVTLREGEDPFQPITIAEIVARPRDEQLTRPREDESPIERVRINSRRSRPPYLPLEDGMNQEEILRRAMRNQEISELDRLDRRTRNNESARRTRERTRKTIADQADTIEQQNTQIQGLQRQITSHQQEIQQLRLDLVNERRNADDVDSLFQG